MKRTGRLAAVLVLGGLIAGCAPAEVPSFTPPPVPEFAPPAISTDRAQEILADVEAVVVAADATANADDLAARVSGPALDTRRAEYALQSASAGERVPQPLWTDSEITVITASNSWPRSVLAVSNARDDTTVRLYLALVQDGPREPYRLVEWTRLLPGVTTPTFASTDVGSAPVSADQEGLTITPTDAFVHLADVFANSESTYAPEFAEDRFRELLATELSGLQEGVAVAGEVSRSATAGPVVFGIGTSEGGAVVMGTIDYTITLRKTIDGAELNLAGEMAWLGGADQVAAAANATYRQMITLYIPPDGSDAQMQILGAERVLTGVERVE